MRSVVMGAACAAVICSLAGAANAASSPQVGEEWISYTLRSTKFEDTDTPVRRSAKARPAQRAVTAGGDEASAGKTRRRLPRVTYEDVGTGRGQSGIASYYWQPQRVASGGWFNPNAMTAAHKTLPFGTRVRVTHASTGRSVTVTINDRGPYVAGRIIDLSSAAAGAIGMKQSGVARVNMQVLGR